LKSTRRDAFISFLSAAAATGLALGTAVLILALAALSGFQEALKAEVLARTPEIEIAPAPGEPAATVRQRIAAVPGVAETRVESRGQAWLAVGGRVRAVDLVGYEGELPPAFDATAGRSPGLYLPRQLATAWGLAAGDAVEIVSGRPTLSPVEGCRVLCAGIGTKNVSAAPDSDLQELLAELLLERALDDALLGCEAMPP